MYITNITVYVFKKIVTLAIVQTYMLICFCNKAINKLIHMGDSSPNSSEINTGFVYE